MNAGLWQLGQLGQLGEVEVHALVVQEGAVGVGQEGGQEVVDAAMQMWACSWAVLLLLLLPLAIQMVLHQWTNPL